jgi:hypothetical protein
MTNAFYLGLLVNVVLLKAEKISTVVFSNCDFHFTFTYSALQVVQTNGNGMYIFFCVVLTSISNYLILAYNLIVGCFFMASLPTAVWMVLCTDGDYENSVLPCDTYFLSSSLSSKTE